METRSLESLVDPIMALYRTLPLRPPSQQYTILASFFLTSGDSGLYKIISVATGTKCLPVNKLPLDGESVHDSHAEVLARRGAVRWFLEEIGRCHRAFDTGFQSDWISLYPDGKYALKNDARLMLYVSTVPCEVFVSTPSCADSKHRCSKVGMLPCASWPPRRTNKWPH